MLELPLGWPVGSLSCDYQEGMLLVGLMLESEEGDSWGFLVHMAAAPLLSSAQHCLQRAPPQVPAQADSIVRNERFFYVPQRHRPAVPASASLE